MVEARRPQLQTALMAGPVGMVLPPPPRQPTYRIEKLNPLAMPKNVSLSCELTGRPALVRLITPQISINFASREVAMEAWEGVLCKIAHVMGTLLAPAASVGSELERADRARDVAACQVALVALCNEEASRHIVQGHFDLAVPAATYSLRFATSAYGAGKLQLVPAYLYLAEAYLGSTQYRKAEEFLTLANWSLLKTSGASNALRSQLRRNFGKLYASQGRFEEALRQLADDVYYSSLMVVSPLIFSRVFTRHTTEHTVHEAAGGRCLQLVADGG